MKSCPQCNRTYADDSFTFCLDDGALLSAPYDPQSTLHLPASRDTDQPRTEILTSPLMPGDPYSAPPQARTPASNRFSYPQEAAASPPSQRRSNNTKMIVGGVIVLLTAGVLLLGYIVWRGNQNPSSSTEKSDANAHTNSAVVTPTAQTNNSVSVNTGGEISPKPTVNQSAQWLDGVWEGRGTQHAPKMTWSVKLTAENNTYAIEYPSLRCGGKWTLVEMGDGHAKFKETITHGLERCSNDGDILVEKISDYQVSYKYTLPIIGEVATATLSKGAGH